MRQIGTPIYTLTAARPSNRSSDWLRTCALVKQGFKSEHMPEDGRRLPD